MIEFRIHITLTSSMVGEYPRAADAAHFAWQTTGPYLAATEAALLREVVVGEAERLLEIGAGEGANLHHLHELGQRGALRVGIDRSAAKVAFGRRATSAHFVTGDAAALPFADDSFDVVLIRDLLHHLPDLPARVVALREARRVLRPSGRLHLIEPNVLSPLALLQALTVSSERGILSSTAARLRQELTAAGFTIVRERAEQAFPVSRVVLHPRLGWPGLGAHRAVSSLLAAVENAARLLPRCVWLYLSFQAMPRR